MNMSVSDSGKSGCGAIFSCGTDAVRPTRAVADGAWRR
jgi:hypothetical protein